MSASTFSFFICWEFTRIFNHTLEVILVKSELIYKKRKPIFCASNALLFNSAAINTHLDGKHPEQLQNHSNHYHLFYFGPMAKRKKKKTRLKIYQDFMTQTYAYSSIKPPPYPNQEYPILVSTKRAQKYYTAPQRSIENASLLETRKLLSVLI